ncbi:arylsulfatase [Lysobacter niastensis]|uniref:Arylsulfatase n=2 Tax=Lysobacter niastensis TaxID=380629 RepID=A0ABU1W8H4_9GAMM|nr:arylsulfatase [Lysobacter niastensis]
MSDNKGAPGRSSCFFVPISNFLWNKNAREKMHSRALPSRQFNPVLGTFQTHCRKDACSTPSAPFRRRSMSEKGPNIVYFLVDNLGFGELGCYGGGILRGADTRRIDAFAGEGKMLLNFAPEAQCTPSRSALMTGRYAIRSGNHTVAMAGSEGGLVAWERTMGDVLSEHGYATACMGKWHIGASEGRWPIDHGFDEWYGIPRTWDESLWLDDPWYDPARDLVSHVMEGRKGEQVYPVAQLTLDVRRDIDTEFLARSKDFIKRSVDAKAPFFLYFNHSLMHLPTIPRLEFKGKSGQGDWADCLLQLDADFGTMLDYLDELGIADDTIVVFSGDNGPEEVQLWRGHSGFFAGSYFTGMEGSLRTPCVVRYPGRVPVGAKSNEIVHITDMYTTLLRWAGTDAPQDRVIDGVDQRDFLEGRQETSAREGFPYWMGDVLYGVKWQNFKLAMYSQKTLTEPAQKLASPYLINLMTDPGEREAFDLPYLHSWVGVHFAKILGDFARSVKREPPIPAGAPLDHVPVSKR